MGNTYYLLRTLSKGRVNVDEVDRRSLERGIVGMWGGFFVKESHRAIEDKRRSGVFVVTVRLR